MVQWFIETAEFKMDDKTGRFQVQSGSDFRLWEEWTSSMAPGAKPLLRAAHSQGYSPHPEDRVGTGWWRPRGLRPRRLGLRPSGLRPNGPPQQAAPDLKGPELPQEGQSNRVPTSPPHWHGPSERHQHPSSSHTLSPNPSSTRTPLQVSQSTSLHPCC